jgi:hypothetical protein
MDSRILLLAVLAISLSCAMEISLEELTPGRVHYRVVERGASGSTLYLIAMLGETQYSVTPITEFNGIAEGEIFLLDEGEYTVTAKNLDTGSEASAQIRVPQPRTLAQAQESSEELQEQFVEAQSTLPISGDSPFLLLGAAVLLLVLLAAVIIYANPFKQQSAGKKRTKK